MSLEGNLEDPVAALGKYARDGVWETVGSDDEVI